MRTLIFFSLTTFIFLSTSCSKDSKKREMYHFKSDIGYCHEWSEEQKDPQTIPPEIGRGACPQTMLVSGVDKAERYASCPSKNSSSEPETMVFYTRQAGEKGKTVDFTRLSPAEICARWKD